MKCARSNWVPPLVPPMPVPSCQAEPEHINHPLLSIHSRLYAAVVCAPAVPWISCDYRPSVSEFSSLTRAGLSIHTGSINLDDGRRRFVRRGSTVGPSLPTRYEAETGAQPLRLVHTNSKKKLLLVLILNNMIILLP